MVEEMKIKTQEKGQDIILKKVLFTSDKGEPANTKARLSDFSYYMIILENFGCGFLVAWYKKQGEAPPNNGIIYYFERK